MNTWMSAAEQDEVWDRYEAGEYMRPIAAWDALPLSGLHRANQLWSKARRPYSQSRVISDVPVRLEPAQSCQAGPGQGHPDPGM
jgi:hypothetical protein